LALDSKRIKGEHRHVKDVLRFDEIGYWSEIKLDIIREYAAAYSAILSAQERPALQHIYIDAFAGAGMHLSRRTGEFVPGSPLNALNVNPSFREYHLIDTDARKVGSLKKLVGSRPDVFIHEGDCNRVLLEQVFPRVKYEDYRRALCILDPYGLHLEWSVIQAAGQSRTIDMFLNFPVLDMNRNALWREPAKVSVEQAARMTAFWGDDSWQSDAYVRSRDLFGDERVEKESNRVIAQAFGERLRRVAGFRKVPNAMPMRNQNKAIVYYLFFASQKGTAENIVLDIFRKYAERGGR
jgi:three-Cys-motif partner protein